MKVVFFASQAKKDLLDITHYIVKDKPQAAKKWSKSVKESVTNLVHFPRLGRIVPEYSDDTIRELIQAQYRIVYKIDEQNSIVVIIIVHHSKRKLT
jgi:addiction module RelE/StbE family toxin